MNEVLNQATKKIAAIIQKTMNKTSMNNRMGGVPMQDLELLIKGDGTD
eukprot:CAMPEP_0176379418 /NCGR_PEP_ID=MMETSP0126-20121128/30343_1 /TAXON_ID=141414 ORGANISM="Strombidinopsis acuminatum, Strain SPMC142" /NCGR_SAMPLE_ID=MMETSP0126 /ASSEMBLY_ACC=CAM_ASM_000229 /LENGTH=47 /DNA_ID= /DNA_START= /DNA_END= /DNA_ORIENTATION=